MMDWSRAQRALFFTAFLAGGLFPQMASAQECTGLPRSSLKMYRLTADHVTEHAATRAEIEDIVTALAGTPSAHPLMAIVDAIDTRVAVEHRVVERPEGYCDAPAAVLLGLGVARRDVFILREAAIDHCVREALLTHEAEHDRALGKAIHDFIQQHRPKLVERLEEFKRQSARDRQSAMQAFDAGLRMLLATMLMEFKEEKIGDIKQTVDSVSRLSALSNACNGKLGELEKMSRGKAL
jgi:hypothetical protein